MPVRPGRRIEASKSADRPTLIALKTVIGYGSPNKADTHAAHGEPLGPDEIKLTKKAYGWPEDSSFLVPDGVYDRFKDVKSFCLLETCPKQFTENSAKAKRNYDPSFLGASKDPFNVFKGTQFESALVAPTGFGAEMHQKKADAKTKA